MTRQSVVVKIAEVMGTPESLLKKADPCTMIIFGAGGDLTRRKLMPALFHLRLHGFLPEDFRVIGVAREPFDDQSFRVAMRKAIAEFAPKDMNAKVWDQFESRLFYITGDLDKLETYKKLSERLAQVERGLPPDQCGRLCYLAIPPSVYADVVNLLTSSNVAPRVHDTRERPWARVIIEKPFGKSLDSARALNSVVRRQLAEHQVYRIDHYLGKETVQNLLVFRFANSIFEPIWNRQHIHHVQITAAESVGVENRGGYYEQAGVVRDMFQNHLLQLLCMTA
ncbi:MAG TPA: glucose-6-phosphate dehydrogenase, partial [Gemmatimonadales bacterium]